MPPLSGHYIAQRFTLLILFHILLSACSSLVIAGVVTVSSTQSPERASALRGVRRTLEDYSQMLAERMLSNAVGSASEDESSDEDSSRQYDSTSAPSTSTADTLGVVGGSTNEPSEAVGHLDAPLSRRLRSTYGRHHSRGNSGAAADTWSHHHHRRRRKGCPPLHGKDQLLCPSRNTHRYDVCISQQQLCDHVRDCPDGEDEDPSQCFFYKPLDAQLKTLSHAVLLLVDNVMGEHQPRAEL